MPRRGAEERHAYRKRRKHCQLQLRKALEKHARGVQTLCVIDRVNWNAEQRSDFTSECERANLDESLVMAVHVNGASVEECLNRVLTRKDHPSLNPRGSGGKANCRKVVNLYAFGKRRVTPPSSAEGFGQVVNIDSTDDARVNQLVALLTSEEDGHAGEHDAGDGGDDDGNDGVDGDDDGAFALRVDMRLLESPPIVLWYCTVWYGHPILRAYKRRVVGSSAFIIR